MYAGMPVHTHRATGALLPLYQCTIYHYSASTAASYTGTRLPGCPAARQSANPQPPVHQHMHPNLLAHTRQGTSDQPSPPCLPAHSRLSTSAPCSLPRHSLSRMPASLRANGCLCKNAQPRVCERIRQPTNTYPLGLQPTRTAASLPGHTHQSTSTQVPAGQRAVPVPARASQTSSAQALFYQQTRMRAHE
jgi:hypothetical protein